jgi:eukaryotic-like serine/threonine-protein kinase
MTNLHHCGDIIDERYQIVTLLGQGGTGKTYSAIDLINGKKVAIKAVFLSEITDWKTLDLFEREAKVLATLNHPFIPKYLDYFYLDTETDRRFYLVQELVTGESLFNLVKKGLHFTEEEVKNIGIQVLEILNYIHQLSPPVIHRDLKPQNLICNEENQIYLVDFGAVQDLYHNTLNLTGTIVGTFGYMPPEQFRGKAFFASDLYSLGATLIFLLTHRSPAELPNQRLKIDFRSKITVSEEFAHWLDKMTAPTFEERYHSAEEALQILQKKRQITNDFELKSVSHRPPKGSKINLNWSENELNIKIPPAGWNGETFKTLLTAISAMVFSGTISIFYLLNNSIFSFLFLIILGVNSLVFLLLCGFLWRIFGRVEITINRDIFIINRKLFNFKYKRSGETNDLTNISVINDINYQGRYGLYCTLEQRVETYNWYKFGNGLTSVEQDWLVKEMRDFIRQIRLK